MFKIAYTNIADKWVAKFIGKPTKTTLPSPVMILDVSGSMGNNTFKVVASYKSLLLSSGYPRDTKIRFITFGEYEASFEFTLGTLNSRSREFNSEYHRSTKMAPIVPLLKKVVHQTTEPLWITIISDGILNDASLFHDKFQETFGDFSPQSRISVSMVRLSTNYYGCPETKALCAISTLSAAGGSLKEFDDSDDIETLIELPVQGVFCKLSTQFSLPLPQAILQTKFIWLMVMYSLCPRSQTNWLLEMNRWKWKK